MENDECRMKCTLGLSFVIFHSSFFIRQGSRGWNRTNAVQLQRLAMLPTASTLEKVTPTCHQGSGRRGRTSVSWFKARRPTASRSPNVVLPIDSRRVSCGSRTRLSGLEDQCLKPIGQGHAEAEGVRVELTRLVARLFSKQLPSPIGLPFPASCGGRNRTCVVALNRRPPVPTQAPPQCF